MLSIAYYLYTQNSIIMKKQKYLKRWQQEHPAVRVHRYLRELLTHYIGFAAEDCCIPEMSGIVLDITAVM